MSLSLSSSTTTTNTTTTATTHQQHKYVLRLSSATPFASSSIKHHYASSIKSSSSINYLHLLRLLEIWRQRKTGDKDKHGEHVDIWNQRETHRNTEKHMETKRSILLYSVSLNSFCACDCKYMFMYLVHDCVHKYLYKFVISSISSKQQEQQDSGPSLSSLSSGTSYLICCLNDRFSLRKPLLLSPSKSSPSLVPI